MVCFEQLLVKVSIRILSQASLLQYSYWIFLIVEINDLLGFYAIKDFIQ
ncbi:MAG: hypothetical protein PWR20_183 [Bacteroidales bacterium]|jgi:hypothetical protein|nr:hypothetical protein [Bacteroidales bacterium]